jgi:hypothetical protein
MLGLMDWLDWRGLVSLAVVAFGVPEEEAEEAVVGLVIDVGTPADFDSPGMIGNEEAGRW